MNYEVLLQAKLKNTFPDESVRERVCEILEAYGLESHEQEPFRVRLAVLKLGGPETVEIEKWTKYAKEDFRDILAWAEYPRQSKNWSIPDGPKKRELIAADKQEYVQWLNT
jgi:hypothetical protein